MKIDKTELSQRIKKLKNVVPIKTNNPVLQGILVQDGYLTASNMEMTIKARVEGTEGESFIIPLKAFDLINNLPDGEVEITASQIKKTHGITINAAKIKNKYQVMDASLFPLPNISSEEEGEFTIDSEVLITSMKRVSYAIATGQQNPALNTLCLYAANGTLDFVGSDAHVMAWDKVSFDGDFKLLIPKVTVDKIIAIGINGKVSIKHNKSTAVFVTDEYEIHTRIVSGDYFKYHNIFKEFRLHTVISRMELLGAVTRAKMCTEDRCSAKFVLEGSLLNLSIKDKITDYSETLDLQEEMAELFTIAFDARLVLETLKAFDCDNVGLSFDSPKMPMIVEAEDSDFKAIVLPVAIQ